ncbi:hypothetical protein BW1_047_00400 [Bacillus mycoides NBRC 101238 = DSM 11821]|nr:hypothetical protein BW1_047_00400 [Bacillus mycoides NBRC 101238 = DSM 11821]
MNLSNFIEYTERMCNIGFNEVRIIMKFLRVSQVSELTGLYPISLRRMLVEHATIQKNKSFII